MADTTEIEKQIRLAYIFLRENDHSVPSDVLDLMLNASLIHVRGCDLEKQPNISRAFRKKLRMKILYHAGKEKNRAEAKDYIQASYHNTCSISLIDVILLADQ